MLNIIVIAIIAASAVWVYWDASGHKIGKVKEAGGLFNMSAGAWGTVTLLLWIIGFPAYLIKRNSLKKNAVDRPARSPARPLKAGIFGLLGLGWVWLTFGAVSLSQLPACGSPEVKSLVGEIINGMPVVQAAEARFVSLEAVREQGFNAQEEIRVCAGTLVTTQGEDKLQFSIAWQDKDAAQFYVEAQIQ